MKIAGGDKTVCVGVTLGGNANVGVHIGSTRLFRYKHGGIGNTKLRPNARPKCAWVCVLVEYRLY